MSARSAILGAIRETIDARRASAADEYAAIDRAYAGVNERGSIAEGGFRLQAEDHLVQLFASRIVHYDGSVLQCTRAALPQTIAQVLDARGKRSLHVPADIDRSWLPAGVEFIADTAATADALDRSEGVVTGCTAAIALTGTIVLTHVRGDGRRALTLVPDYHLSIVFAEQIVETVPEGVRRAAFAPRASAAAPAAGGPALLTFVSGPSATADIEMTRIKGVHGPRTLDVVIVSSGGM